MGGGNQWRLRLNRAQAQLPQRQLGLCLIAYLWSLLYANMCAELLHPLLHKFRCFPAHNQQDAPRCKLYVVSCLLCAAKQNNCHNLWQKLSCLSLSRCQCNRLIQTINSISCLFPTVSPPLLLPNCSKLIERQITLQVVVDAVAANWCKLLPFTSALDTVKPTQRHDLSEAEFFMKKARADRYSRSISRCLTQLP